jgi:sterol desaturase/sphingolipid hydroxylase (fatty acid hydroxylase superfamily)
MGTYLLVAAQVALGLVYANLMEWLLHRYILHGLGKSRKSIFSFHWKVHHRTSRQNNFYDKDYDTIFSWNANSKEVLGLLLVFAPHVLLVLVAPWFVLTLVYAGCNYFYKHRKAHKNPKWAKRSLRWHYDHHMGKDQNCNWCVTRPWADIVLGTRKQYDYDD